MALQVSQASCEIREVKLSAKPAAMIEASPKATVPVLVLPDGQILDESLDIMLWTLGQNDPEGWLARHDTKLVETCDGGFKHNLDRYKYHHRYEGCDPMEHRAGGLEFLQLLENRLTDQAQLSGQTRGLSDAAIMPFVRQFAATDPIWFAAQDLPHLQIWLDHHLASPLFEQAMAKRLPWREGADPEVLGNR